MPTQQAIIREPDCIGCTKCLSVCPTDAIIGAQNFLHSVIVKDCIGCERCVPACPVDCIELKPMDDEYNPEVLEGGAKEARIDYIRDLAQSHKQRLVDTQQQFENSKKESEARRGYLNALFNKTKL